MNSLKFLFQLTWNFFKGGKSFIMMFVGYIYGVGSTSTSEPKVGLFEIQCYDTLMEFNAVFYKLYTLICSFIWLIHSVLPIGLFVLVICLLIWLVWVFISLGIYLYVLQTMEYDKEDKSLQEKQFTQNIMAIFDANSTNKMILLENEEIIFVVQKKQGKLLEELKSVPKILVNKCKPKV